MGLFKTAFRNSLKDIEFLIKKQAGPLLAVFIGCELLSQMFTLMQDSLPPYQNIGFMLLQLSVSMVEGFLISVIVYRRLYEHQNNEKQHGLGHDLKKYMSPLVNESLRALGITLLWSLLLILPGIYKYFRFLFVINVVLLDPKYMNGEVDALKESERLTKGIWIPLMFLSVLSGVLMWYFEYLLEKLSVISNFPLWSLLTLSLMAVILYLNVLLYEIYSVKKTL